VYASFELLRDVGEDRICKAKRGKNLIRSINFQAFISNVHYTVFYGITLIERFKYIVLHCNTMPKKPTSVRLTEENESKLKAIAKRDGLTISQIINKSIDNYSGKENKPASSSESDAINKRFEALEKELALQRQRINIFKNQIDFVIKSQNGRIGSDKYSKVDRSKQSLAGYPK